MIKNQMYLLFTVIIKSNQNIFLKSTASRIKKPRNKNQKNQDSKIQVPTKLPQDENPSSRPRPQACPNWRTQHHHRRSSQQRHGENRRHHCIQC